MRDSLTPEQLSNLINTTVKAFLSQSAGEISLDVTLSEQDAAKIKEAFLAKLQKEIKQSIHVKASDEIGKGFIISFDGGKSCFDFSDKSLAEYLGAYLSREIATLVKDSVSS